jgi:hypothetical protein
LNGFPVKGNFYEYPNMAFNSIEWIQELLKRLMREQKFYLSIPLNGF